MTTFNQELEKRSELIEDEVFKKALLEHNKLEIDFELPEIIFILDKKLKYLEIGDGVALIKSLADRKRQVLDVEFAEKIASTVLSTSDTVKNIIDLWFDFEGLTEISLSTSIDKNGFVHGLSSEVNKLKHDELILENHPVRITLENYQIERISDLIDPEILKELAVFPANFQVPLYSSDRTHQYFIEDVEPDPELESLIVNLLKTKK